MSKNIKTVSISVPRGYEKEVAHFSEQPNKSRYIWELVKQDMERQSIDNQILEIVKQAMQGINPMIQANNVNNLQQLNNVNNLQQSTRKKGALSILQD